MDSRCLSFFVASPGKLGTLRKMSWSFWLGQGRGNFARSGTEEYFCEGCTKLESLMGRVSWGRWGFSGKVNFLRNVVVGNENFEGLIQCFGGWIIYDNETNSKIISRLLNFGLRNIPLELFLPYLLRILRYVQDLWSRKL